MMCLTRLAQGLWPRASRALVLQLLASVTLSAAQLGAQVVRGSVVQELTRRGIGEVTLVLLNAAGDTIDGPVRSDSAGRFVLRGGAPGNYRIVARQVGYEPVTADSIGLEYMALKELQISMAQGTTVLQPVRVTAVSRLSANELMSTEGFELRRRLHLGDVYLDTADIRRAGGSPIPDMLASIVPGMRIIRQTDLLEDELRVFVRQPWRNDTLGCLPYFYVDGRRLNVNPTSMIASLSPGDIYGIEVYKGSLDFPPEFPGANVTRILARDFSEKEHRDEPWREVIYRAEQVCGMVALWTRSFARTRDLVEYQSEEDMFWELHWLIARGNITAVTRALLVDLRVEPEQRRRIHELQGAYVQAEREVKSNARVRWNALPDSRAATTDSAATAIAQLQDNFAAAIRSVLALEQLRVFDRNWAAFVAERGSRTDASSGPAGFPP